MVKLEDIAHHLDNQFTELRNTGATLLARLGESVHNLSVNLHVCEDMLTSQSACLDKVEQAQVAIVAQLTTLHVSVAAVSTATVVLSANSVTFSPSLPSVHDVTRELDMRISKKTNIVSAAFSHLQWPLNLHSSLICCALS